jgi:hypothetical protein
MSHLIALIALAPGVAIAAWGLAGITCMAQEAASLRRRSEPAEAEVSDGR